MIPASIVLVSAVSRVQEFRPHPPRLAMLTSKERSTCL